MASRKTTKAGGTYSLDVYAPKRQGELVSLSVRLTVTKLAQGTDPDRGLLARGVADGAAGRTNGLGLIDPQGKKIYLPATTKKSDPTTALCSPELTGDINQGDQILVTCTFAGVPASVTAVSVDAVSFGVVPNVSLA